MAKLQTPPLPLPLKGGEWATAYGLRSSSPPFKGGGRGGVCIVIIHIWLQKYKKPFK